MTAELLCEFLEAWFYAHLQYQNLCLPTGEVHLHDGVAQHQQPEVRHPIIENWSIWAGMLPKFSQQCADDLRSTTTSKH